MIAALVALLTLPLVSCRGAGGPDRASPEFCERTQRMVTEDVTGTLRNARQLLASGTGTCARFDQLRYRAAGVLDGYRIAAIPFSRTHVPVRRTLDALEAYSVVMLIDPSCDEVELAALAPDARARLDAELTKVQAIADAAGAACR